MSPEAAIAAEVDASKATAGVHVAAVEDAILGLTRVWSDARLYPPAHPVIADRLAEAEARLTGVLAGTDQLTIKHLDGDLVYGTRRLFKDQPRPAGLIGALNRLGIGCLTFLPGVTAEELGELCRTLTEDSEGLRDSSAIRRHFSESGVAHIDIDRLAVARPDGAGGGTGLSITQLYNCAMDVARHIMQSARLGRRIDMASAQAVTEQMVAEITQDPATAVGLACLRGHDEYSFAHSVHTALLGLALGDFVGFTPEELRELGLAAILHDVGKAVVPIEILRKPGKLSDSEWDLMTHHPAEGATMLLDYDGLPPCVPIVAFEHHIGCDLSGYPKIGRKRELSLLSTIVSLSDVYDALTTHRPYRPPVSPEQAIAEMGRMCGQLDPRLVDWFRGMMGVYPPGTCVVLDTGECGVVCTSNHDDPERPHVAILTDAHGLRCATPRDVDLTAQHNGQHARSITRTVQPAQLGIDPTAAIEDWVMRHQRGTESTEDR